MFYIDIKRAIEHSLYPRKEGAKGGASVISRPEMGSPDLDSRSFTFTVNTSEELRPGETLVVRDVEHTQSGVQVLAVTEKAVREEARKLLNSL